MKFTRLLVTIAMLWSCVVSAGADIYQWEWIDPAQPELGKQQSTTLCVDGAGITAEPGADLSGLNLQQAWLAGADLRNAFLFEANLASAELSGANLCGSSGGDANFADATLVGAYLHDVHLGSADFDRANLREAYMAGSGFYGADFYAANLSGANLEGTQIANGRLQNADLTDATIIGVEFGYGNLSKAQLYSTASYKMGRLNGITIRDSDEEGWNFAGQELAGANLADGVLQNADLTGAIITGATLSGEFLTLAQIYSTANYAWQALPGVKLASADLSGADFSNISFRDGSLVGSDLTDADFTGAILTNTHLFRCNLSAEQISSTANYQEGNLRFFDFTEMDLTGWSFAGIDCTGAIFEEATLTDADFTDTDIRGANFRDTTQRGLTPEMIYSTASYAEGNLTDINFTWNGTAYWDFSGQNLTGAKFGNTSAYGADFSDAILTGNVLYDCDLEGADLRGARDRGVTKPYDLQNTILEDGRIEGLDLAQMIYPTGECREYPTAYTDTLVVRDHRIPITVAGYLTMNECSIMRFVVRDGDWTSTISFEPEVQPDLTGTLMLAVDPAGDVANLPGSTFQLFDWSGVTVTGEFDTIITEPGTVWDTSDLLVGGTVTLTSAWKAGDADRDGDVDLDDFAILKDNFGATRRVTWTEGDFDNNGTVDLADFVQLKTNFDEE